MTAQADFIHERASKEDFAKFYEEWLEKACREEYRKLPGPYEV